MRVMIVGCGRAGAELANQLARTGHAVTVIDVTDKAFLNLAGDFRGRLFEGEVLNRDVLVNAGITETDSLATMTNSDALNAVVGHIGKMVYHVPHVITRIYDPRWLPLHEAFGLTAVNSVQWTAERSIELLMGQPASLAQPLGVGVALYELQVPRQWSSKGLNELTAGLEVVVASIVRRGQGMVPSADASLLEGDRIVVSATQAAYQQTVARLVDKPLIHKTLKSRA